MVAFLQSAYKQNTYHYKGLFKIFFKLGQHGAHQVKFFPSEGIDSSNRTAVVLKAGVKRKIKKSYIFGLYIIILL